MGIGIAIPYQEQYACYKDVMPIGKGAEALAAKKVLPRV